MMRRSELSPARSPADGQTVAGTNFAHPVEKALARVFDRLGIMWRYEPRTFPLSWRDGEVVEACTPDFYLPEIGVYVECTVMKQRLANRKTRKYRKLRSQFGVVAEIMYRRDFIRLSRRHGFPELEEAAREASSAPGGIRDLPLDAVGDVRPRT